MSPGLKAGEKQGNQADGIGWQIFKEAGLLDGPEKTIFSFSIKLPPSERNILSIAPPENAQRIGRNESLASDLCK